MRKILRNMLRNEMEKMGIKHINRRKNGESPFMRYWRAYMFDKYTKLEAQYHAKK